MEANSGGDGQRQQEAGGAAVAVVPQLMSGSGGGKAGDGMRATSLQWLAGAGKKDVQWEMPGGDNNGPAGDHDPFTAPSDVVISTDGCNHSAVMLAGGGQDEGLTEVGIAEVQAAPRAVRFRRL